MCKLYLKTRLCWGFIFLLTILLPLGAFAQTLTTFHQEAAQQEKSQGGLTIMTIDYKHQPDSYWHQALKPEVYKICRDRGTEPSGSGVYDKFYEKGTYACGCCGGDFPLFGSETKFDSGTGWPSFWAPISEKSVDLREDNRIISRFFGARTEALCSRCGSHLGHLFLDGPKAHGSNRYCMNSLALSFIPAPLAQQKREER